MDKETYQNNSRKTFSNFMTRKKNKMLGQILTIVEGLVTNNFQWEKNRKNILGICNDFCRDLELELSNNYTMDYVGQIEDVIQIIPTKSGLKGGGE